GGIREEGAPPGEGERRTAGEGASRRRKRAGTVPARSRPEEKRPLSVTRLADDVAARGFALRARGKQAQVVGQESRHHPAVAHRGLERSAFEDRRDPGRLRVADDPTAELDDE